jgi:hypothetical protein
MVLKRKKKTNKAAPAAAAAGATGAAGALVGYALRRRRRGREAEPPATSEAVMPDTSSDPLVDEQTEAAAAEAGSIGGHPNEMATGDAAFPEDPGLQSAEEASGDSEESFEAGTEEVGR